MSRRDPYLWAFGAPGNGWNDNAKAMFLWISHHRPDIRAVWISGSRELSERLAMAGCLSVWRESPEGRALCREAGVHVYSSFPSDTLYPESYGAFHVNLWHGVGIKAIGRSVVNGPVHQLYSRPAWHPERLRSMAMFVRPDLLLAPSEWTAGNFSEAFDVDQSRCLMEGYPRVEAIGCDWADKDGGVTAVREFAAHLRKRFRRIYLFMPTWRDGKPDFMESALGDMTDLDAALARKSAALVVKTHLNTPKSGVFSENVIPWPEDLDVQWAFSEVDALITDYSSVAYDWLAVRREGLCIHAFDLEDYLRRDRNLLMDFGEAVAGTKTSSPAELVQAILDGSVEAPIENGERDRLLAHFWGRRTHAGSCERIADRICDGVGISGKP